MVDENEQAATAADDETSGADDEPAAADDEQAAAASPPADAPPVNVQALERELARHERETRKALGGAFDEMEPCAACGSLGYMPRDATPPPEVLPDPKLVVCPDCNGYGQRSTPSVNPQYALIPCTSCSGSGYQDAAQLEAQQVAQRYAAQAAAVPAPSPSQPPQPVWNELLQRWETPSGQPIYVPSGPRP